MRPESYLTPGGISVARTMSKISYARGLSGLLRKLDTQRGIYLSSGYEYPERYSRWTWQPSRLPSKSSLLDAKSSSVRSTSAAKF